MLYNLQNSSIYLFIYTSIHFHINKKLIFFHGNYFIVYKFNTEFNKHVISYFLSTKKNTFIIFIQIVLQNYI